jgi:hypothetical protein
MKKLSQMSSEEIELVSTKRALRKAEGKMSALQGEVAARHAELARIRMLVNQLRIDELTEWANE